jgi:hypothetical protein
MATIQLRGPEARRIPPLASRQALFCWNGRRMAPADHDPGSSACLLDFPRGVHAWAEIETDGERRP